VHQADADQGDAQVAGRLEVIAGQDTQAAGVNRDALMDAELRREVRHPARLGLAIRFLVPGGTGHVMVESFLNSVHVGQEAVVSLELFQTGLFDRAQELDGTIFDGLEAIVVNASEKRNRLVVPAPPQVIGQLVQSLQALGQVGEHRESADRTTSHRNLLATPIPFQAKAWDKQLVAYRDQAELQSRFDQFTWLGPKTRWQTALWSEHLLFPTRHDPC